MLSEFDLIARYFTRPLRPDSRAALGVGDDCALLAPGPGMQLAISTDMLVEGRHFFAGCDPAKLGHKSLAVNLSDLSAMGARPLAFTLALALPEAQDTWLAEFSRGLFALADQYDCELIGGDTTKGPLNICITIFGELKAGTALRRDTARAGDDIWISGTLGDARLALAGYRNELVLPAALQDAAAERLHRPTPRVALGLALVGIAHAAIDISDGLSGDLAHILTQSGKGARINVDALPVGPTLAALAAHAQFNSSSAARTDLLDLRRKFALTGGDDYELCFTAPAASCDAVLAAAGSTGVQITRIGSILAQPGLHLLDENANALTLPLNSFDHFTSP
ncbi:thiamine-phosphate kinase [soil metagenome]